MLLFVHLMERAERYPSFWDTISQEGYSKAVGPILSLMTSLLPVSSNNCCLSLGLSYFLWPSLPISSFPCHAPPIEAVRKPGVGGVASAILICESLGKLTSAYHEAPGLLAQGIRIIAVGCILSPTQEGHGQGTVPSKQEQLSRMHSC